MNRALVAAGLTVALAGQAKTPALHGPTRPSTPGRSVTRAADPLPMLASLPRVRVEVAHDRLIVLEEIELPRGDWTSGGLDLYVAFGAPGVPIAVDAQVIAVMPGAGETTLGERGDPAAVEPTASRPAAVRPLLGKSQMAGVVVHVKDAQLRDIYDSNGSAGLRIRSLLAPPATDASGAHDVVVRLGIPGGLPLTLGRIEVVSLGPEPAITRAEANLCGPEADEWPLAVTVLPQENRSPSVPSRPRIAPTAAVRHASDDLCIRWWAPG